MTNATCMRRLALVTSLPVLLCACAGSVPLASSIEASTTDVPRPALSQLTPPQDRQWPDPLADATNQRTRGFGLVHAPELDAYLNRLFQQIKATAGTPDWPGRVYLLSNSSLDAYATAAGNVYIALPWIRSVESEDELVALLAHEFGHIYLHCHQLEGALAQTDSATSAVAVGMMLARKGLQASEWSQLDSLLFAYTASRQVGTGIYSRSQELAADRFALAVTVRMKRPVGTGLKSMLERLQTWEKQNQDRLLAQEKAVRDGIAQASEARTESEAAKLKTGVAKSMMRFSGAVDNAGRQLERSISQGLRDLVAGMSESHPSTSERIDVLVRLAEMHSDELSEVEASTAALTDILKLRSVSTLLDHYQLAFDVVANPNAPQARAAAREASSGITRTHALPLYAAYVAQQEGGASAPVAQLAVNFASPQDRAWFLYQEQAQRLARQGTPKLAGTVINQGLNDFKGALAPELYAVRFLGEYFNWNFAKDRARQCAQLFPSAASQCKDAAMSPPEREQQAALNRRKAEGMTKKLFK